MGEVKPPQSEKTEKNPQGAPAQHSEVQGLAEARRSGRRSQRVHIRIPVLIYGNRQEEPFREETHTEVVNAHGALIKMATPVESGQSLFITHMLSLEEEICRVVFVGNVEEGKAHVGLEFQQASPRFWRITFPPEDWDPSERKLPQAHPQAHPQKPRR